MVATKVAELMESFITIARAEVRLQAGLSAVVLIAWYVGMKHFFARRTGQPVAPKQSAWILSLFVSVFSTPFGIHYGLEVLKPGWRGSIMLEEDELSKVLLVFFITYLVLDTALGLVEYGSEFGLLSGCEYAGKAAPMDTRVEHSWVTWGILANP
jgi:hypothetical protein